MTYIPHTDEERANMLAAIGVERIEDLFCDVPKRARFPKLALPRALSEMEVADEKFPILHKFLKIQQEDTRNCF